MEKEKVYSNTYFPPEVIIEAVNVLTSFIEDEKRQRTEVTRRITFKSEESWSYDTDEEFFADYRKPFSNALYGLGWFYFNIKASIYERNTRITVRARERKQIEPTFRINTSIP